MGKEDKNKGRREYLQSCLRRGTDQPLCGYGKAMPPTATYEDIKTYQHQVEKNIELSSPKNFIGKSKSDLDLINRFGVQLIAIKELVPKKARMKRVILYLIFR